MRIRTAGSKRGCVFIFNVDSDFLFSYTFFESFYSIWRSGLNESEKNYCPGSTENFEEGGKHNELLQGNVACPGRPGRRVGWGSCGSLFSAF